MWAINFLPWHEQRQIYYRRRYCKILLLVALLFFTSQIISIIYFNNKAQPNDISAPQSNIKKICEDKFLKSLTLQAILINNEKYQMLTLNESGKTMVLPVEKINCWEIIKVENEKITLENKGSHKIVLWELGKRYPTEPRA
jgi:hypothetical protein